MKSEDVIKLADTFYLNETGSEKERSLFIKENKESIISSISDDEWKVLSYLELKKEEKRENISSLFHLSNRKINNLIARYLITEKDGILSNSPTIDASSIYPLFGQKRKKERKRLDLNAVRIISSLASKGGIKEKTAKNLFSKYGIDEKLSSYVLERLRALRIIKEGEKRIKTDNARLLAFLSLDTPSLLSYLVGESVEEDISKYVCFLSYVFLIDGIKKENMEMMMRIIASLSGASIEEEKLFLFNLLYEDEGYVYSALDEEKADSITISNDFSITFKNAVPPLIAISAEPLSCFGINIFTLTKRGIYNALSLSYSSSEIIRYFESISNYELPLSVKSRIDFWAEDFKRIKIINATIIKADSALKTILLHDKEMEAHILYSFEDVFLLNPYTEEEWRNILIMRGFADLPETQGAEFKRKEKLFPLENHESNEIKLREEREIEYDEERKASLVSLLDGFEKRDKNLIRFLISSSVIFSPSLFERIRMFPSFSAFNYQGKKKCIKSAEANRDYVIQAEDADGRSSVLYVDKTEDDEIFYKERIIKISKLYSIRVIPSFFI
ncbi:MAG TPA: helicase-associated domain-containing protein [Candidatus Ornithospirochaeta avicola]|uniref:Helicase-associated domain-containing protein n=1 Tax=Candidatus Ornithospirochaeta avicola TaxID=2840896 RepID=A0A9D1PSW5_9SPIO|nr:helicase-associated domain-containing protein [Candidatus Ornithospirochaeta avicola]